VEGPTGSAGATGGTAIAVLDVDHDYATNTKNSNGYAITKTTPIAASTIGAIDDIIRIEMDVIGDVAADILYGIKVEFDGNVMLELDNLIGSGTSSGNNATRIVLDLIVTSTNAEITPYASFTLSKGMRTLQSLYFEENKVAFYDATASAAITLNSGTKNIVTHLKASGSGNNVSITSYKAFKLLKA
jgi:hypothetical protein